MGSLFERFLIYYNNIINIAMVSIIDFIGTFFFISLGITFILLLLLTIHFQRRLSTIESKEDKLFEIMNNMVKEMTYIKHVTNVLISEKEKHDNIKSIDVLTGIVGCDVDYDEHDSDIDNDNDSDSDSDDSDDDSEPRFKIVVSDDEGDDEFITSQFIVSNIKIINLQDDEEPKVVLLDEIDEELLIDETIVIVEDNVLVEDDIVDYSKESVQTLKTMVTSKKLSSAPSKLKRNELLKLLGSNV